MRGMVDLQKYADDARSYAVTYFANHKIMSWATRVIGCESR